MNPFGYLYAAQFAQQFTDAIAPQRRRNPMRNPLWPDPTPTQYRIGRLNNPEIRPRIGFGRYEVRPRLDWDAPSPTAHVRPRSPLKGRISIPRKQKLKKRSPFKGLKVNKPKRKSTFVANYIKRHSHGKKLTPKQRGKLLAAAMAAKRGKRTKRTSVTKKNHYSASRHYKSPTRRYSTYGRRSYGTPTGNSLVKIYAKTEQIFATGSVNAGTHGIKKSDKFTHKFTSRPAIYGVPVTGRYTLPKGAIVIKGPKALFKSFGSKEFPSFRSSKRLRSSRSRRYL